ncbi:MAG: sugar transferase [Candidatus Latescibacteria bacterium]|nr:sugar transferase [Candidatus Latescibacterota bacterium]
MSTVREIFTHWRNIKILKKVYPVEHFHRFLVNERYRSDRNDYKFSLVTFNIGNCKDNIISAGQIISVITSRVRSSDVTGWFDDQKIGVILPETSLKGARVLAHTLCHRIADISYTPPCMVFTYPSSEWNIHYPGLSYTGDFMYEKLARGCGMPLWKRTMDVIGSSFGLIFFSPFFAIVALIILSVSKGPIFFRQERVGLGGKIYKLYKFRTMEEHNDFTVHRSHSKAYINGNTDGEKPMYKLDHRDPRIVPFGNFLRVTCLDELPQLINVLQGEMSLVGPRPCITYEAEEYLRWQTHRFDITPGMTGLWQVSGKNRTTFKEMIRLDIKYAVERSFILDMKILFQTPKVLLVQLYESIADKKHNKPYEKSGVNVKTVEV